MDIKTLRAVFTGGSYCKTRPLTRQDYGIKLQFVHADLDQYGTYQVHFSNVKDNNGTAKTQIADADGVVIPDEYLVTGKTVYAWAFVQSESAGRTRCMVEIPVAEKPTVTPEEPTPQQRSAIDEAIDALNTGVTRAETAAEGAEQSATEAREAAENIQQAVDDALQEAKDSGEFDGANGVTYTPTVDAEGVISWVNDGGLPNPEPRNIRGPKGEKLTYADLTAADKADLIQGPIADAQTAAVAAVNQAGTTQTGNVNAVGAAQVQAVEDKGAEVLESIPADYTELSEDVDNLKSAINDPVTGLDTKAPIIVNSASGAIASFDDGADNMPVKQLTVNVEPVQDLHGYENPWPAGGGKNVMPPAAAESQEHDGITVTSDGNGKYTCVGTATVSVSFAFSVPEFVIPPSTERTACFMNSEAKGIFVFMNGNTTVDSWQLTSINRKSENYTAMSSKTCNKIRIDFAAETTVNMTISPMLLAKNEDTSVFVPYSNICPISGRTSATIYHSGADTSDPTTYTIQLGNTVYGGTLDVTGGKMVVDKAIDKISDVACGKTASNYQTFFVTPTHTMASGENIALVQSSSWRGLPQNQISSSADNYVWGSSANGTIRIKTTTYASLTAPEFKTEFADAQLCYYLATPIEITLTPTQISTLLGTNNIWSEAGPVDVDYPADTKLYIDNIHQPTEDDMIADAQIASGKYFLVGGNLYRSTTVIPAGDTIIPGTNCIKTNLAEALNALNT